MHTCEQRRHSKCSSEFFAVVIKGHWAGLCTPRTNIVQSYKLGWLMLKVGIQGVWLEETPESLTAFGKDGIWIVWL